MTQPRVSSTEDRKPVVSTMCVVPVSLRGDIGFRGIDDGDSGYIYIYYIYMYVVVNPGAYYAGLVFRRSSFNTRTR